MGHERNNLKRGLFFFLDQNHTLPMVEGNLKLRLSRPPLCFESSRGLPLLRELV